MLKLLSLSMDMPWSIKVVRGPAVAFFITLVVGASFADDDKNVDQEQPVTMENLQGRIRGKTVRQFFPCYKVSARLSCACAGFL